MKIIAHIVSNAIDLAGGALVEKLPEGAATLHVLNALADMDLEARDAGLRSISKETIRLAGGNRTGSLPFRPELIVYASDGGYCGGSGYGARRIISLCSDAEDLIRAERQNREALLVTGNDNELRYELSFAPAWDTAVELWGKAETAAIKSVNQKLPFPAEYAGKAATDAALLLLDDLLLAEDSQRVARFVSSRADKLAVRKRTLDYWFSNYCSRSSDAGANDFARDYDPFADGELNGAFEL